MTGGAMTGGRGGGIGHRFALWMAGMARAPQDFAIRPEPRTIGIYARGRQLVAGNVLLAGHLVEARGQMLWDLVAPDPAFLAEAHGFGWLDDLAALGDGAARKRAQEWTFAWIGRYGGGQGAGWAPGVTGRRIVRWINHGTFLLAGAEGAARQDFFRALARQTGYLARRWTTASPGIERFEALSGLVQSAAALPGMTRHLGPAASALARECVHEIDPGGAIASRNPEELLEILSLLNWAAQSLTEAGRPVPEDLQSAIARIAPCLRALRHADGGLARFHGGGRGGEGRLDQALAASGTKTLPGRDLAMGFARLAAGRTTVIVDAASPPAGPAAHASTLGFEMTSGRRPVIVSCGSGTAFGADWHRAGRATASHATLSVEGVSSSRFGKGDDASAALAQCARITDLERDDSRDSHVLYLAHDGWVATHGLTHARRLSLSADGRRLTGHDSLAAVSVADRRRIEAIVTRTRLEGVRFALRFHLHPDVDARLDMGGTAVSLALKSGEIWVFRFDGAAELQLAPSVYLEKGRLKPRPTRQIMLSAYATEVETRIGWTFAKAQDTPLAIRDFGLDDPVPS